MSNSHSIGVPLSLEFFPPKTEEGVGKLRAVRQQLYALQPAFCSVTYGAGGSTRQCSSPFRHRALQKMRT